MRRCTGRRRTWRKGLVQRGCAGVGGVERSEAPRGRTPRRSSRPARARSAGRWSCGACAARRAHCRPAGKRRERKRLLPIIAWGTRKGAVNVGRSPRVHRRGRTGHGLGPGDGGPRRPRRARHGLFGGRGPSRPARRRCPRRRSWMFTWAIKRSRRWRTSCSTEGSPWCFTPPLRSPRKSPVVMVRWRVAPNPCPRTG